MYGRILCSLSFLVLGACSTYQGDTTVTPTASLAAFSAFTISDLQAADSDAVAAGDQISHACYPALITFVQSLPTSPGTVSGAFSAFQKARDIRHGIEGGLPTYLKIGCAPLVMDERMLIARLAVIGGVAAP